MRLEAYGGAGVAGSSCSVARSPGLGVPAGRAGSAPGLSPSGLPCSWRAKSWAGLGLAMPTASSPSSWMGSRETNSFWSNVTTT